MFGDTKQRIMGGAGGSDYIGVDAIDIDDSGSLMAHNTSVEQQLTNPNQTGEYASSGNETIDFTSGATNNMAYGGSSGSDALYGGDGNDTLYAGSGDDALYGDNGNDILYAGSGTDVLDGGAGNDYLYGGTGNDMFLWGQGSGNDIINAGYSGAHGQDTLQFQNIVLDSMAFTKHNNDLICTLGQTGERVTISNWCLGSNYQINQIQFADQTLTAAKVSSKII